VSLAREMLEASPVASELGIEEVAEAIEACLTCAQTCTSCADSDLAEKEIAELSRCAALCTECADICITTMQTLSRVFASDHRVTHRVLRACVLTCTTTAEECERHAAHHRHCAVCAKACRACLRACDALLQTEAFEQLEKLAGG
jgi:hypothetical protein